MLIAITQVIEGFKKGLEFQSLIGINVNCNGGQTMRSPFKRSFNP